MRVDVLLDESRLHALLALSSISISSPYPYTALEQCESNIRLHKIMQATLNTMKGWYADARSRP